MIKKITQGIMVGADFLSKEYPFYTTHAQILLLAYLQMLGLPQTNT